MFYTRFGLMILVSTIVMFILMYLNTYAWAHVYFSETRAYMAILMGATMAVVMLAFMLGMYPDRRLNIAIFTGAVVIFGLSLWLVRSQVTVSGTSYMRAMIPHHSIAILTSERAQIRDARVAGLAQGIIEAQRREIAKMAYLTNALESGDTVQDVYRDPPARPGSVADALSNTLISQLDLSPLSGPEAETVLDPGPRCAFRQDPVADPVLWLAPDGSAAAMKLNGILVHLDGAEGPETGVLRFAASGASVTLRQLGGAADRHADAELVFTLDQGLTVGYRGFYGCAAG